MATLTRLTLTEGNDEKVTLYAVRDGSPMNVSTVTDIELFLKASATQPDLGLAPQSLTGGDIEVTDAAGGIAVASVPGAAVTADLTFWRADVLDGDGRHTIMYGPLKVTDV